MLAIGRSTFACFAQSSWPVAASVRIAAFALTPRGAPATSISGPVGAGAAAGEVFG